MPTRKLGRGLESLLQGSRGRDREVAPTKKESAASAPASRLPDSEATSSSAEATADQVLEISVDSIQPNPQQPRLSYDAAELQALKASIEREGVLQPLLVRRTDEGYQLVAGERRFRAAREIGRKTVPALVVDVADDKLLELALIENVHREDLNPIDTAKAFVQLQQLKGWKQEQLARNLGLGRATVSNTVRLLELPAPIQRALEKGQIQVGHAKVLLSIPDAVGQMELFERIAEDRLSVRELEIAREAIPEPTDKKSGRARRRRKRKASPSKPANIAQLESELSEAVGTRVRIDEKSGKGLIKIEFYSPDDFQAIRKLLLARKKRS